ncbi:MAG: hypothetical protein HY868_19305 [Chloroflexi bacterium]|nr:hypothetical protein [Chloroflexota bacterium]
MPQIKRISKQTGGDLFEFRDAPLLRSLARRKTSWSLLLETPLGLHNPNYRVDLKEGGGNQKDRLNMEAKTDAFNVQIARMVGLTGTEFPGEVFSVTVDIKADPSMSNLIARMTAVETEEGTVDFDCPFTPNCLTFTEEYKSRLWLYHLKHLRQRDPFIFIQAANKIDSFCRQVHEHRAGLRHKDAQGEKIQETLENNLLLLSRYWEWLGIDLGIHVTRFPDQPYAAISFAGHGRISRGVELKYDSNGYTRAGYKAKEKGREMIVLCFEHNDRKLLQSEDYLDVVDASELGRFMVSELAKIEKTEKGE